jgi:hypothetical protein
MGKKGVDAGLIHSAHIVILLFLALERSSEKLLHLDGRRCLGLRPHAQRDPIPQVEDDHDGKQQLQNSRPKPLHLDSHPTLFRPCRAAAGIRVQGGGFAGCGKVELGRKDVPQGLNRLGESSVLEGHGLSRDVSSLRDPPDKP